MYIGLDNNHSIKRTPLLSLSSDIDEEYQFSPVVVKEKGNPITQVKLCGSDGI